VFPGKFSVFSPKSVVAAAFACALAAPSLARADEPLSPGEPRLMNEAGEITTVVDAFDKDNPFDLHIFLGFQQRWKSSKIRRETAINQPGLSTGGFTATSENVAQYSQATSTLDVGADVGLYKDLALVLRLPIIISDTRELSDLDGSSKNPQRRSDPSGEELFPLPFRSPKRSGIDWLSVGLKYAITNQRRDSSKPTWVIGADGRFGIGPRLHACNDNADIKCPDPANPSLARDAGMSRGMNAVVLHTIVSKRLGYVEPYLGFQGLIEFPQSNSDFGATSDLRGSLLTRPPVVGTITLGTEIIPWERPEQFQRVTLDVRLRGAYHSPGRDYSELYDALGSSKAASLRSGNPSAYRADQNQRSVADTQASKVYFSGLTDQQGFGTFGGQAGATWQAGEYIKFSAGFGLTYVQPHLITAADACNPGFRSDPGAAGPCRSAPSQGLATVTGIPNPNYRAVIDAPGRRFLADDTFLYDLSLSSVVMF
jgi:hypothetical protein